MIELPVMGKLSAIVAEHKFWYSVVTEMCLEMFFNYFCCRVKHFTGLLPMLSVYLPTFPKTLNA